MTIKQQLTEDMKTAMRARDSVRLGVVRFMMSELKNYEIDNGEQTDDGVLKLIAKQVKQMKDAILEFEKGGRADIVAEEQAKVKILEAYLPQQISDDELHQIVQAALTEVGSTAMNQVMPAVMKAVAGRADGGRVSAKVKELLA